MLVAGVVHLSVQAGFKCHVGGSFLQSAAVSSVMPKKDVKKPDLLALEGLAKKWEADKATRKLLLSTGHILKWTEPKKVGVINLETMRPNANVLEILLHRYLPDAPELRTINVFAARREACEAEVC